MKALVIIRVPDKPLCQDVTLAWHGQRAKFFFGLLALFLLMLGLHQPARAQFVAGAHVGYNLDVRTVDNEQGALAVGGQMQFRIEPLPIVLNPALDVFMTGGDEFSALQLDINVILPFLLEAEWVTPYIGAGMAVTRLSADGSLAGIGGDAQQQDGAVDSTTDYGPNLLAGVLLGAGAVRPFVQARGTLGRHAIFADEAGSFGEGFGISAGILVRLSQ